MLVSGLNIETIEYGYRFDGPYDPKNGLRFDRNRVIWMLATIRILQRTLELIAEVVDGNGLHYHVVLEHWSVSENGENIDDDFLGLRDLFEQITDDKGNILYEVDEADYR